MNEEIMENTINTQFSEVSISDFCKYMKQKKYDFIVSIGEDCSATGYLRKLNFQNMSYPFDWLTKAPFINRIELIVNDFENFMNKDSFKFLYKDPAVFAHTDSKYDYYEHLENKLYFYHDFKHGKDFDKVFPEVKDKYERRISRFYERIKSSQKILFVWLGRHEKVGSDTLDSASERLKIKFPDKEIHLLVLENDKTVTAGGFKYRVTNEEITHIQYDNTSYDLSNPLTACMGHIENTKLILSQLITLPKPLPNWKNWLIKVGKLPCIFIFNSDKRKMYRDELIQKVSSL